MDQLLRMALPFRDLSDLSYSIHISLRNRYIYFNNPKCGCSFTKALLNIWEATEQQKKISYETLADVHDRAKGLLYEPKQVGWETFLEFLNDSSFRKVAFVRDPVSRIYSAFLNKVAGQYGPHWQALQEKLRILGSKTPEPMNFDSFINVLAIEEIRNMDEHWRGQYEQLCLDFVKFDFVGRFENLENDAIDLRRFLFDDHKYIGFSEARKISLMASSGASRNLIHVTSEQVAAIRKIYARDIETFYSE
jgi:hypothetical protein